MLARRTSGHHQLHSDSGSSVQSSGGSDSGTSLVSSFAASTGEEEYKAAKLVKKIIPAVVRAGKNDRLVCIDGVEFSELHPKGAHNGYSIKCKHPLHIDCKRSCGFGTMSPMSPAECRRRLLRWRDDAHNFAGTAEHMPSGGKLLIVYA